MAIDMLGIWKRKWYSTLLGLLFGCLFAFLPDDLALSALGPRGASYQVYFGIVLGLIAGWPAFALQEHLRKPAKSK